MQKSKQTIKCKNCSSFKIVKKGFQKNRLQTLQKYQCKDCNSIFTINTEQAEGKTYPLKVILKALSTYNLGYSLEKTAEIINKNYNLTISTKTISNWISEYKNICTFARLRKQTTKNYTPKTIIQKHILNHIQPYTFKYHKAKLNILTKENPKFKIIKNYFEKISSKEFPHHIFTYNKNNSNNQRASQLKFNHLKIKTLSKSNQANKLATLALQLSKSNRDRHQLIQDFMLINDSTTIAAEIPVYLTNWDAGYYRNQSRFSFSLSNYQTPITGHIDILQIRNGLIHILDYKPEADKTNATEQLTIYALALSRKLNLELYYSKAAWFDENFYNEFFPLHAVYEKR